MGRWQATHHTYSAGREALAERFIFGVLYDVKSNALCGELSLQSVCDNIGN